MVGLTAGGLLNIFGDWLLIRKFHLGITGAGISTAVSQYISLVLLMLPFLLGQVESSLHIKYLSRDVRTVSGIVLVGMPSMMRQGLNSASVMALNLCAAPFGDAAIAAMSITSRIVNFMFCISVGIGQGFQPVSAFNYGAKKYGRVKQACVFTCLSSILLMLAAAVLGIIFAQPLVALFRDDPAVIQIGTAALRLQSISLVLMPVSLCGICCSRVWAGRWKAPFWPASAAASCLFRSCCFSAISAGFWGFSWPSLPQTSSHPR